MVTRLETQLRNLKTVLFNMNLLLLLLSSPKLLENFRAFLFQREFVLCVVSASLKSCSISLQSFSLLGLMSNVGYDFLGRRNLWVLYTKKLLSLSPVFLKSFDASSWATLYSVIVTVLFQAWLGFGWQNLLNCVVPLVNALGRFGLCLQLVVL